MPAKEISIKGIVQGVGFRPLCLHRHTVLNINGWVRNSSAGVEIHAEGTSENLDLFVSVLQTDPPPLATIDEFFVSEGESEKFESFEIFHSEKIEGEFIPISPDVSICSDCQNELFDRQDHRYRYPFINCTNCGPRLTIIKDIPYDRPFTTMAEFPLCPVCKAEYEDPLNRRFHAQPVACPDCGPHIWFQTKDGKKLAKGAGLVKAREFIREGKIVAVKGLGGFHLACDALNKDAVEALRDRKKRSDKPFAVMVPDIDTARKYCKISSAQKILLTGKEKPIVILEKLAVNKIPEAIAPNRKTIGVMLPYTPLHFLLIQKEHGFPEMLIMTSGNISEEPIAYANTDAVSNLSEIADGFLINNRDIHLRVDDSVVAEHDAKAYFLRRSRGYSPRAINLPRKVSDILAVGPELKNTFCVSKEAYAFMSHHIGDLKNYETLQSLRSGVDHYTQLFKATPKYVACDLHPDYLSTRFAREYASKNDIPLYFVQHHHAHLASCLADNGWDGQDKIIGFSFDGTGFGADGAIWGGEVLVGNYQEFDRHYHLEYMPLPGGDAGTKNPNRIAASYLWNAEVEQAEKTFALQSLSIKEQEILAAQIKAKINTPQTSSMGRLFDVVASMIGLRHTVTYEGQAAIELEQIIDCDSDSAYHFDIHKERITFSELLQDVVDDILARIPSSVISGKFHNAVSNLVIQLSKVIRDTQGINTVALSGGVWQNIYLLERTVSALRADKFKSSHPPSGTRK